MTSLWDIAWQGIAIIFGTFVSEDLTCIASGLLVRDGALNPVVGVAGCFLGIYLGDLGLWLLGWAGGRTAWRWQWLARRIERPGVDRLRCWFDQHGLAAILASRFLPGMRLPMYVALGACGQKGKQFALWTFVAAAVWTPLVVLGVAHFGQLFLQPLEAYLGRGWLAIPLAVVLIWFVLRMLKTVLSPAGRYRLVARVSRLWRWEFWPTWLSYLPLLPWFGYLAIKYRGMTVWTSANPGIPQGGVVGESKSAILAQLPELWRVPSVLVAPGEPGNRVRPLREFVSQRGWQFPLALKPDAGQRGAGFRLARGWVDVIDYLAENPGPMLAQTFHPGPYEAGIFYYRLPGEATGHIFSITDKVFPEIVGDGHSSLEDLIWRHPRYRMQAATFLRRHDRDLSLILPAGKRFPLAVAGNHCQGTMFRDGSHLLTPALSERVDSIARQFPGFYIGRFDVRYRNIDHFMAGRDLAIVELNGVTSESSNVYDPGRSVWWAYRTLARQWELLFRIGNANRRRGIQVTGVGELVRLLGRYYRHARIDPLAD